jgi:gas vesicle protein
MSSSEGNGGMSFAAGFVMGAVIGAALGILFAPKAGRETREDLRRVSRDLRDKASEKASKLRETGERILHRDRAGDAPAGS